MARSSWSTQDKLLCVCVCVCVCVCACAHMCVLFCFGIFCVSEGFTLIFTFYFCFLTERERKNMMLVGREVRRFWEELGHGKYAHNMFSENFITTTVIACACVPLPLLKRHGREECWGFLAYFLSSRTSENPCLKKQGVWNLRNVTCC